MTLKPSASLQWPATEIEMLREAMREAQPFCMTEGAKILRDAEQYAAQEVAAEREKCAGECESEASMWEADGRGVATEARLCAARIRARSTVTQPTKVQLPYELGPLPARVVVDRHTPTGVVTYGYTDAMVIAYAAEQVAKERERWSVGL